MREIVLTIPTLLAWLAVAYKLPALRRNPADPGLRAYWLTLVALALASTIERPAIYLALDGLIAIPNLARLLSNGLTLVAAWSVQVFLLHLSYPVHLARPRARWAGGLLVVALVAMAGLFARIPVAGETYDFTTRYADAAFYLEYRLVFLTYLGMALVTVARLSWRYSRLSQRPATRLGLRLVAAGAVVGLAYIAHEALRVIVRRVGGAYPVPQPSLVTDGLIALTLILILTGATMPAWGPRVGLPRLLRWVERYRACRQLYPLWRALGQAVPELVLLAPPSPLADLLAVRGVTFQLSRRVIEIRDSQIALRPYLESSVVELAWTRATNAGLAADAAVVVEATSLAAALRARAQGRRALAPAAPPERRGGEDLDSEAAWLGRVAEAWRRSPIVREVVAHRVPTTPDPTTASAGGQS